MISSVKVNAVVRTGNGFVVMPSIRRSINGAGQTFQRK
jgi:hypothetical protein